MLKVCGHVTAGGHVCVCVQCALGLQRFLDPPLPRRQAPEYWNNPCHNATATT